VHCPTIDQSWPLSFWYDVTDASHPGTKVTVT